MGPFSSPGSVASQLREDLAGGHVGEIRGIGPRLVVEVRNSSGVGENEGGGESGGGGGGAVLVRLSGGGGAL